MIFIMGVNYHTIMEKLEVTDFENKVLPSMQEF